MLLNTVACLSTFLFTLASVVYAAPAPTDHRAIIDRPFGTPGQEFCLLMPPRCGLSIHDNYANVISWCTSFIDALSYERILPDGFIKSFRIESISVPGEVGILTVDDMQG